MCRFIQSEVKQYRLVMISLNILLKKRVLITKIQPCQMQLFFFWMRSCSTISRLLLLISNINRLATANHLSQLLKTQALLLDKLRVTLKSILSTLFRLHQLIKNYRSQPREPWVAPIPSRKNLFKKLLQMRPSYQENKRWWLKAGDKTALSWGLKSPKTNGLISMKSILTLVRYWDLKRRRKLSN